MSLDDENIAAVEREIDQQHLSNPLLQCSFAEAAWQLLSVSEQFLRIQRSPGRRLEEDRAISSRFLNFLNHGLRWLGDECAPGGKPRRQFDDRLSQAAQDMIQLAIQYDVFFDVFTAWRRHIISLRVEDNRLIPGHERSEEYRCQCYNHLASAGAEDASLNLQALAEVQTSITPDGESFRVVVSPRIIEGVMQALKPIVENQFTLPPHWRFSRYSLQDFKLVHSAVRAIATLQHWAARALDEEDQGFRAFLGTVYLSGNTDLYRRVARYTGLETQTVSEILHDLTYGSQGMRRPDPALQPLIMLNEHTCAISPNLWIATAPERNLGVLLNRIPAEAAIYSTLTNDKEGLMRFEIAEAIRQTGRYRTASGAVPGRPDLPDIDLAIIDDRAKACLLIELKWFIHPDEIREQEYRQEEIAKGMRQATALRAVFRSGCPDLLQMLGISGEYQGFVCVSSANWIGDSSAATSDVPVINSAHLISRIISSLSLPEVFTWLEKREYLPVEGRDFTVQPIQATVGKWHVEWYALQTLSGPEFLRR